MANLPLSKRIFLLVGSVFFLLLAVTSAIIYIFFSNLLIANTEAFLHLTMQQNQNIVNSAMNRVSEVTSEFANDRYIYEVILQPLSDSFVDQSITRLELTRYLTRSVYVPLRGHFRTVNYWFFINENIPASAIYAGYSYPANRVLSGELAQPLPFYERALAAGGRVYWFFRDDQPSKIYAACLIRSSFSPVTIADLGVLLLEFDTVDLFGSIEPTPLTHHSIYYLVDGRGQPRSVVRSQDAAPPDISAFLAANGLNRANLRVDRSYRGEDHLYNVLSLDSGWLLVGVTPYDDITRQTRGISEFLLPLTGISLLAVLLLSYIIARSVSRPISILSQTMRQAADESNLNLTLPQHTQTLEIAVLYASYNALIARIKQLLKEVYEKGISVKQAEIRALQAQINPHFLYNTLDSISWAAMDLGAAEIPSIVSSLSNILRYSIKEPDKLVMLEEELKIVQDYLAIQNFCYSLDIDLAVEGPLPGARQQFPKLSFQPIVENAIIHGFLEHNQKAGTIRLRAVEVEDEIRYEIENPCEADIEKMNEIIHGSAEQHKHGIRNVHNRLQMLFGAGSGLSFARSGSGGLVVTLIIQRHRQEQEAPRGGG